MTARNEAIVHAVADRLPACDRRSPPELLDEGFGSLVLRVGGSVVRAARSLDAQRGQELESKLLPRLARILPVEVPAITLIPVSESLPYGATVHPFLAGRRVTVQDADTWPMLAEDIATFLVALHGIEWEKLTDVPRWNADERLSGLGDALSEARGFCGTDVDARWHDCRGWVSSSHREVLSHGDAWYGNMLIDPRTGRLIGFLDFESALIADPAFDLASVFHMPRGFAERCLAAYRHSTGTDRALRERIEAHRFVREITGLDFALRNGLPEEVEDILGNIRSLLGEPFPS